MNSQNAIVEAVQNCGGLTETARKTGARGYQTVQQWIEAGQVPAWACPALERESGISRLHFRKDAQKVWPELVDKAVA